MGMANLTHLCTSKGKSAGAIANLLMEKLWQICLAGTLAMANLTHWFTSYGESTHFCIAVANQGTVIPGIRTL